MESGRCGHAEKEPRAPSTLYGDAKIMVDFDVNIKPLFFDKNMMLFEQNFSGNRNRIYGG